MEEIQILVPKALVNPGQGLLSFVVELADPKRTRDWAVRCRIEDMEDVKGSAGAFPPHGKLVLRIPNDIAGEILATLELVQAKTGSELVGSFQISVNRANTGQVNIQAGGGKVDAGGVIYQPIDLAGVSGQKVEVAGDRVRLTIPLTSVHAQHGLTLAQAAEKLRFLQLPPASDGTLRVLAAHLGETLILGRCLARQLGDRARARLAATGAELVDWVTWWDDPDLPQLWARLEIVSRAGEPVLVVENLTDYSRGKVDLTLQMLSPGGSALPLTGLPPGARKELVLEPDAVLRLGIGAGSTHRRLAALHFDELMVGGVALPVLRSTETTFRWQPSGQSAALVRWLGLWIPWRRAKIEQVMALESSPVAVGFPAEGIHLRLQWSADRRGAMLVSNIDLQGEKAV